MKISSVQESEMFQLRGQVFTFSIGFTKSIAIQPNKEKRSITTIQISVQKVCQYFCYFSDLPKVSEKWK